MPCLITKMFQEKKKRKEERRKKNLRTQTVHNTLLALAKYLTTPKNKPTKREHVTDKQNIPTLQLRHCYYARVNITQR